MQEYTREFREEVYNHLAKYMKPSFCRAMIDLSVTFIMFYICLQFQSILWSPLLALVFVRFFVIFHDLGHDIYFPFYDFNYLFGTIVGAIVLTPLSSWTKVHNHHHANSNKLNVEQHSQTAIWTVQAYERNPSLGKLIYRLKYGKYTLFTINPIIYFLILNRFGAKYYEHITQILYLYIMYCYLDVSQYLYFVTSVWLAAILGFILFHAQHTFDASYKGYENVTSSNPDLWNPFLNGMLGSSFIQVPWLLQFFTYNIEYHHIHHLRMKIPSYRLRQCHEDAQHLFTNVRRVTFRDILSTLTYSLYDKQKGKYIDVYTL